MVFGASRELRQHLRGGGRKVFGSFAGLAAT